MTKVVKEHQEKEFEMHSFAYKYQFIELGYHTSEEPILLLKSKDPEREFMAHESKWSLHWGQGKLLLGEVYFLTKYFSKGDIVIYAGAAEGKHIILIHKMFPGIKLLLVDPAKFNNNLIELSENTDDIEIVNDYFTNEYAKKLSKDYTNSKILFISDIRTISKESDIEEDMKLQENWIKILNPRKSFIKFRLPWEKKKMKYLNGVLFKQQFSPATSTETRLIVSDPNSEKIWDCKKYERQMFYHNTISRLKYYDWARDNYEEVIKDIKGMDHCFDCSSSLLIFEKYLNKYNVYRNMRDLYSDFIKISFHKKHNMFTWYIRQHANTISRRVDNEYIRVSQIINLLKSESYRNKSLLFNKLNPIIKKLNFIVQEYNNIKYGKRRLRY